MNLEKTVHLVVRVVVLMVSSAAAAICFAAPAPGHGQVQLMLDLQGIRGQVNGVAFSADGKHLAACGGKEVRVWDMETGQLHFTLRGQVDAGSYGDCLAVAFSPDNCYLVVGIDNHTDQGSLRVYETENLREIKCLLPGNRWPVTRLAFSQDSRYLAVADSSGTISIFDWPLRRMVATVRPNDHVQGEYSAFAFPTDEHFLVVRGASDESVIAIPSGKLLEEDRYDSRLFTRWLGDYEACVRPLGTIAHCTLQLQQHTWAAAGKARREGRSAHWAACWNGAAALPRCTYRGHHRPITALALSPSCRLIASGDVSGAIHVWDAETAEQRYELRSTSQPVYRAAYDVASHTIGFAITPCKAPAGPVTASAESIACSI